MLKQLIGFMKKLWQGIKRFFKEDFLLALVTTVGTPLAIAAVSTSLEPMVLVVLVIMAATSFMRIVWNYVPFPNR